MLNRGSLKVLEDLIVFLSGKPTLFEVLTYLSNKLCQEGNICGVTLGLINEENCIVSVHRLGFDIDSIDEMQIQIDSQFPSAISLKSQNMVILDLEGVPEPLYENNIQTDSKMFKSACYIPLNGKTILILSFVNDFKITQSRQTFLDCIRSVLKMFLTYQSKNYINENELLRSLTPRQELICKGILDGKTNLQIAEELAYSISLIRQETIRIYSKFEVNGRTELKRKLANELKSFV